jgi:ubiquinone/menaquinone biosynthesis C-methylase UbiE
MASAQVAQEANRAYRDPESRKGMAKNLAAPERAGRIQAEKIAAYLELKPGNTVADIGTGAGVMLPFLSKAVGEEGRVIAEDVADEFLNAAREKDAPFGNVEFIRGDVKDAKLPSGCCDALVIVDTYHHFDYPAEMLSSLRKALKKGGWLVIVDYYKRPGALGPGGPDAVQHVRLDMDDAIKEVESNGFRLVRKGEHAAGSQWFGVFAASVQ